MPTVTDTDTITTPGDDIDAGPSHLDAAKAFFSADGTTPDEPIVDNPPKAEDKQAAPAKKVGILDKVLKTAAPAAEEPTAAAAAAEAEDIAKGLQAPPENAKSHAGWQELKKKGNEALQRALAAEKKAAELEAKVKSATPQADEATKSRIQELETQLKSYSERLKVLDLKSHPEFVEKYVKPQSDAKAALADIVKSDESDVNVDELLSLKGKAFNKGVSDALESLTPYARVKFQAALERYIAADLGAQQALAQADEFLKSAKQNVSARSRETFDKVGANYREVFVPIQPDEKADDATKSAAAEYNAALASVQKSAERYAFEKLDEATAADLAHKAALYEFTMTHGMRRIGALFEAELSTRDTKIAELESQVKALTKAAPSVESGAGAASAGDEKGEAEQDHLTAARRYNWGA